MVKTCIGCGSILQSTNKEKNGYIRKDKIENSKYCERCYKIINYNQKQTTKLDITNEEIIKEINSKSHLTFYFVDLLNINSETTNTYNQIKTPKILIISKRDIIPKYLKESKIREFIKKEYKLNTEIVFHSTKKGINIRKLLEQNQNYQKIYIAGYTNSGKSSYLNKIKELYLNDYQKITTSSTPNTTINFLEIKINENLSIYDSPGFAYQKELIESSNYKLIKKISPTETLNPITIQTKENTIINIENIFEISPQNKNSLTFYCSNNLKISKKYQSNSQNSQNKFHIPENSDLIIKSLGFINIKKECNIITNLKEDQIEIRHSIFS